MNRFFAPGGEFHLIEKMFPAARFARDGQGLGDDAFLFEAAPGRTWAVTADASAEGVHYRLDWASPGRALGKALVANLSDINAMGGRAQHLTIGLAAPADLPVAWALDFARGFAAECAEVGATVVAMTPAAMKRMC